MILSLLLRTALPSKEGMMDGAKQSGYDNNEKHQKEM